MDNPARNTLLRTSIAKRCSTRIRRSSIVDHLKNGPHIAAQASGVRVKDRQGRDLIDEYFLGLLADRVGSHPRVGEVGGIGQMLAVEFVAD
jgi:4-aminobutyrate aminotransferase-like enzyme